MSRVGSSRLVPRALGFAAGNFGGGLPNLTSPLADLGLDFGIGSQGGMALGGNGTEDSASIFAVGCNLTGSCLGGGLSGGGLSGGVNLVDGAGASLGGGAIFDFGTGLKGGATFFVRGGTAFLVGTGLYRGAASFAESAASSFGVGAGLIPLGVCL